jgi:hypothetical protein
MLQHFVEGFRLQVLTQSEKVRSRQPVRITIVRQPKQTAEFADRIRSLENEQEKICSFLDLMLDGVLPPVNISPDHP